MRISHDCRCGFKSAGIRTVYEHLAVVAAHDPFCVLLIQNQAQGKPDRDPKHDEVAP